MLLRMIYEFISSLVKRTTEGKPIIKSPDRHTQTEKTQIQSKLNTNNKAKTKTKKIRSTPVKDLFEKVLFDEAALYNSH